MCVCVCVCVSVGVSLCVLGGVCVLRFCAVRCPRQLRGPRVLGLWGGEEGGRSGLPVAGAFPVSPVGGRAPGCLWPVPARRVCCLAGASPAKE